MNSKTTLCLSVLVLLSAPGCSSSTDALQPAPSPEAGADSATIEAAAESIDDGPIRLRGACPADKRIGAFSIQVQKDYSFVEGKVADGVVPSSVLQLETSEGECKLLRRKTPVCTPVCGSEETCDLSSKCVPYPRNQNVGVITVFGLNEPVTLTPRSDKTYSNTDVNHPVFDTGDEIRLRGTEGQYGALSLDGVGVAPLTVTTDAWGVKKDNDLLIDWQAGPDPRARIRISLNVDQHGSSPVFLMCELADSGHAVLPKSLINGLIDAGVSGFPSGKLTRLTADSMTVSAGCIELTVETPFVPSVTMTP